MKEKFTNSTYGFSIHLVYFLSPSSHVNSARVRRSLIHFVSEKLLFTCQNIFSWDSREVDLWQVYSLGNGIPFFFFSDLPCTIFIFIKSIMNKQNLNKLQLWEVQNNNFLITRDITSAMLVERTIAEKCFRNLSLLLHKIWATFFYCFGTNMAVLSGECNERIVFDGLIWICK